MVIMTIIIMVIMGTIFLFIASYFYNLGCLKANLLGFGFHKREPNLKQYLVSSEESFFLGVFDHLMHLAMIIIVIMRMAKI